MKVVLIEDEKLAAQHLRDMLLQCTQTIEVLEIIPSVEDAVVWFGEHTADLAFMDIQLEDGLSFEIFDLVQVKIPVIFTTAYDQYAIKAFKVNSVDYLLKPINTNDLQVALDKFEHLFRDTKNYEISLDALLQVKAHIMNHHKSRFLVKAGQHIRSISVDEIAFFYVREKSIFLFTNEKRDYALDLTLDQIEKELDPARFFRINRSFIINIESIRDLIVFSSSRLLIKPSVPFDEEITVSRDKVKEFKEWLDR